MTNEQVCWARLDTITHDLRLQRIKENVDYSLTMKYGYVHVMCGDVWEDAIRETFEQHGVKIEQVFTYKVV